MYFLQGFNPRARGGRDFFCHRKKIRNREVSIHAPAGGATKLEVTRTFLLDGFNPRARGGRDSIFLWSGGGTLCFNPRARGGRDHNLYVWSGKRCFNPRARGGRDIHVAVGSGKSRVSIHAPAGGATLLWSRGGRSSLCFNPRARGGRDDSA